MVLLLCICVLLFWHCQFFDGDALSLNKRQLIPLSSTFFSVEWNPVWIPDPEMLSDICFSIGIVLSVSRIAFLMPCNETFGTMLVSFYRTLMDLFKLCGMFGLVILAFTCGIAALYDAMQCHSEAFGR